VIRSGTGDHPTPDEPRQPGTRPEAYRADTDHLGDWYVWRRLSPDGWATLRRCETEAEARRIADELNAQAGETPAS